MRQKERGERKRGEKGRDTTANKKERGREKERGEKGRDTTTRRGER